MPLSGWQAFCARPLPWSIYGSAQTVRDIAAASLCGPFLLHGADDPGSLFSPPELPSASCSCALYGMRLVLAEPGCQASYRECLAGQWLAASGDAAEVWQDNGLAGQCTLLVLVEQGHAVESDPSSLSMSGWTNTGQKQCNLSQLQCTNTGQTYVIAKHKYKICHCTKSGQRMAIRWKDLFLQAQTKSGDETDIPSQKRCKPGPPRLIGWMGRLIAWDRWSMHVIATKKGLRQECAAGACIAHLP